MAPVQSLQNRGATRLDPKRSSGHGEEATCTAPWEITSGSRGIVQMIPPKSTKHYKISDDLGVKTSLPWSEKSRMPPHQPQCPSCAPQDLTQVTSCILHVFRTWSSGSKMFGPRNEKITPIPILDPCTIGVSVCIGNFAPDTILIQHVCVDASEYWKTAQKPDEFDMHTQEKSFWIAICWSK